MLNKFSIQAGVFLVLWAGFPGWRLLEYITQPLLSNNTLLSYLTVEGASRYVFGPLLFLVAPLSYLLGERFEWFVFKKQTPIVTFLLWHDHRLPSYIKRKIHDRIKAKFDIVLPKQKQEVRNVIATACLIWWAVSQIECQVGKHPRVLRRYRRLQFYRHMIGANILALFFTVINICAGRLEVLTALLLAGIYFCTLLLGYFLLIWSYQKYAECLLQQFLHEK